jgi:hypothetical protein
MCKTFSFSFFLIYVYLFYFTHNLTWLTLRHPKLYTYTYVIFDINITYMHNTLKYSPNKRNYCWTKNLTLKNKNLIGKVVIDLDFAKPTKSRLLNHEWGPNYLTISSKIYVHFDKKLLKMGSIEHHLLTFVIFQNMPIHVCISTIHWVLGLESLMCVCKLHRGAYKWV